jgi:hypothetical protein
MMRTTQGQHSRHFVLDFASSPERSSKRPHVKRRELNDPARAPGVDMRTSAGRRFSRIVDSLIGEFGDADPVRLRELAGLKLSVEKMLAAVVGGNQTARKSLVKISDLVDRRERELHGGRGRRSPIAGQDEGAT